MAKNVEAAVENKTLGAIALVCGDEQPTLKAIAAALGIPQQRIYTVSKQPKAGEVYDANVYNWDAIDRFVTRRLDPDKGIGTHEDVIRLAVEKDKEFAENDGRRGPRAGASRPGIDLPDGSSIPARKKDIEVGMPVMHKGDNEPIIYDVVLVTETHIVLQRQGWPTLVSMSNWTANQKILTDTASFAELCAQRENAMSAVKAKFADSEE